MGVIEKFNIQLVHIHLKHINGEQGGKESNNVIKSLKLSGEG